MLEHANHLVVDPLHIRVMQDVQIIDRPIKGQIQPTDDQQTEIAQQAANEERRKIEIPCGINLATRNPRSVKLCSLLHKPARSRVPIPIDYLGFTIEDRFVVGYGLDYAEKYRNLPYIGVIGG